MRVISAQRLLEVLLACWVIPEGRKLAHPLCYVELEIVVIAVSANIVLAVFARHLYDCTQFVPSI